MTRLTIAGFIVVLVSSAQALPLVSLQSEDMLTLVREACGAGMHRVNGVCVRTPARRHVSSSSSMTKQRKTIYRPAYGSGITVEPTLLPEAARMKEMQKQWPNQPLCDEGGYRIQPCLFSPGSGRP
jgi:hypothetical protein